MCGIVVTYAADQTGESEQMLDRIAHRGPDGAGARASGRSWLGHRRLAIVDVDGGTQPLIDQDGHVFVGNGEIYNHEQLRAEIGPEHYLTDSDNETALRAVVRWGPKGVARLEGMFAFAVAGQDDTLLAARDPLGIKPLYWAREDDRVTFASELRAFTQAQRRLVETFPPGHWWTRDEGLHAFSDLAPTADMFTDRETARAAVRDAVGAAVRARMMADVGVGVLLSGGLDSSIVAAIAADEARRRGTVLRSFAVGAEGSADLPAARVVAEHLGTEHHERVFTADEAFAALDDVVRSIEHFDPSLVRSAVPNYLVCQLAAKYVKGVLTGEGADELFAGYDYYRDIADDELEAELLRGLRGLHDLNLQRADRVSMAHGLEARVPFLDLGVIAVGARIPAEWKLPGEKGQEKRLLREAFDGWLPDEILWREKAQFGDGSGAPDTLGTEIERHFDGDDWRARSYDGLPAPRSAEEAVYQGIFAEHLGGIRADQVLSVFART